MVKTRVTDRGIICEPGSGFDAGSLKVNGGVSVTAVQSNTKTASFTMTSADAGVLVMSATNGVLTGTMPAASTCAGLTFVVRSSSPSAHVLTASAGDGNAFVEKWSNSVLDFTGSHGTKLVFPSVANSSVAMLCDGANWLVLGGSGSISLVKEAT
jgi:hypothetical protein